VRSSGSGSPTLIQTELVVESVVLPIFALMLFAAEMRKGG